MSIPPASRDSDKPYLAFKDDRLRLVALVSRDIRYVLIAFVSLGGAGATGWYVLTRFT